MKTDRSSYSGINPGMKDALTQLNRLYEDGLIDPEFRR